MSDAYAIAAVTDTLRAILQPVVSEMVPGAQVVARPVDELRNEQGRMLNVFLYQTGISAALRNEDAFALRRGEVGRPALPLVLHYLLTPHVPDDANSEVVGHQMLGAAMGALHDHPELSPVDIAGAAPYSDLDQQIQRVRITPTGMALEEISKLWTAFQSPYRISAAYEARVVLVDSRRPARTALPVLRRGPDDTGAAVRSDATSPLPSLAAAAMPDGRDTALLGDVITLRGANLTAATHTLRLSHRLLTEPVEVTATALSATEVRAVVPDQPDEVPAGIWSASLVLTDADGIAFVTNDIPLPVAPRVTSPLPATVGRDPQGDASITLTCAPAARPGQRVWLLLGGRQIPAEPFGGVTDTAEFQVPNAAAGRHRLRLRVDGVDSPLVDRSVTPPVFDDDQAVTVT